MDLPFSYLLTCSEDGLGSFFLATMNRIAEMKKAKHEIDDRLLELQATADLMEYLRTHERAREKLLDMDALQKSFDFEGKTGTQTLATARAPRGHRGDSA